MTSRTKKLAAAIGVVFLALLLWWALTPGPKPVEKVEAKPVEVAPAPPKAEPAPVVETPKPEPVPVEQPKPVAAEPAPAKPEPAPEPAKEVVQPKPEPASEPVREVAQAKPEPVPAPVAPAVVPEATLQIETKPEPHKNKVSVAYRLGLNISADFHKLGGFSRLHNPGPDTGATENRSYDNGFNFVDISTNAGGYTWYWGYSNNAAISNNTISYEVSTSPTNGISDDNGAGINHGIEIAYSRELYRNEKYRAGVEAAFGWTALNVDDSKTIQNVVNRLIDTFAIPDQVYVIPSAPYSGTYEGPGPIISSDPGTSRQRTVISQAATITGRRELDANIFLIRLGPYLEIPFGQEEKYAFSVNGGLNLVIGDMDFKYTETVDIAGVGSQSRSASGSHTDFLVGAYVGGQISYAIDENWGVFAGAQYQTAGRAVTKKGGKEAILDMGETVVVTVGVSYSF